MMPARLSALVLAAVMLVAAAAGPAGANEQVAARKAFTEGVRLYEVHRYEEALEAFQRAYVKYDAPAFLYNIGQCHRQLGHAQQAITFFQQFLRRSPRSANREEVLRLVAELEARLAAEEEQRKRDAERQREEQARAALAARVPPPAAAAPAPTPAAGALARPAPTRKPVHKKAWFWAVLVTSAAVVGAGVGLGVAFGTPQPPSPTLAPFGPGLR